MHLSTFPLRSCVYTSGLTTREMSQLDMKQPPLAGDGSSTAPVLDTQECFLRYNCIWWAWFTLSDLECKRDLNESRRTDTDKGRSCTLHTHKQLQGTIFTSIIFMLACISTGWADIKGHRASATSTSYKLGTASEICFLLYFPACPMQKLR